MVAFTPILGIEFRVARSLDELEQAYHLVYRSYLKRNYTDEHPSELRMSYFNALAGTTTLVGVSDEGKVVATATVIADSNAGLPMDELYRDELAGLRLAHKRLCEVSMLAIDSDAVEVLDASAPGVPRYQLVFSLFKLVLDFAYQELDADYMCVTVHPRYAKLFRAMSFEDKGAIKSYALVNGSPAVALCVCLHHVRERLSAPGKERFYDFFIRQQTTPAQFEGKLAFTIREMEYFFGALSPLA